jgi:hypothetical protein
MQEEQNLAKLSGLVCMPKTSIETNQVFEKLTSLFQRFVYFEDNDFNTLSVIYVLLTHLYDIFDEIPYIQVSGLKASGKTRLGDVFEGLCFNPFNSSEISEASLYRAISQESAGVTMIIDEADALSGSTRRDILLRILRSGYRRNGNVTRCGLNRTVDRFSTFCPKIVINEKGIDDPALASRTIPILMVKARTDLEKFRFSKAENEFKDVKDLIGSFSEEYRGIISDRYASFQGVDGLSDRDEELWTPILIIAEVLDTALAEPLIKEQMLALAKKIIVQRKRTQLIGNRDAQILEGTQAHIKQMPPSKIDGPCFCVGEDLCKSIKDRWGIPNLELGTVSRVLNRFNLIREVRRPRLKENIKGSETEVQRTCYLFDEERLSNLTREYFEGERS